MPIGNGKFIKPTGKAFKMPMCTVGHWKNGVMIEAISSMTRPGTF
jgi:hypothetical protein